MIAVVMKAGEKEWVRDGKRGHKASFCCRGNAQQTADCLPWGVGAVFRVFLYSLPFTGFYMLDVCGEI